MKKKSAKKRIAPTRPDKENPEWTREDFRRARPAVEVFTELMGREAAEAFVYKKRGRPPKPQTKKLVSMRLDSEVIDAFRARGAGWQTQINDVLREWVETH
ncbi:MAG: BrnA antitoxin family protein [Alphaproteobacteria bacterium]|nr:BrnA antitoxin family protein [Alphaproteobacteria bacterium]